MSVPTAPAMSGKRRRPATVLAQLRENKAAEDRGFTLIELLVVVVIIGVLVGIAVPVYLNYRKGAQDKAAQSDVRNAISSLEGFYNTNNAYPTTFTTGGTTSATNAALQASSGDTLGYAPVTGGSYRVCALSPTGNVYLYVSANGGAVKLATGTWATAADCSGIS